MIVALLRLIVRPSCWLATIPIIAVSLWAATAVVAATLWAGQLSVNDRTFNRPTEPSRSPSGGPCGNLSGIGTAVYYQPLSFTVSADGVYTMTSVYTSATPNGWDGFIFMYSPSFNPMSPTLNCLMAGDDGPGGTAVDSRIVVTLSSGIPYVLVQSSYNNGETGDFSTEVIGAGSVSLPVYLPLINR